MNACRFADAPGIPPRLEEAKHGGNAVKKLCSRCYERKDLEEFPLRGNGCRKECKACWNAWKAEWRAANAEKVRAHKDAWRVRNGLRPSGEIQRERDQARVDRAREKDERSAARMAAYRAVRERTEKPCGICREVKATGEFSPTPSNKVDGLDHVCRPCRREQYRRLRQSDAYHARKATPQWKAARLATSIRQRGKRYGVTECVTTADVLAIFEAYGRRCFACAATADLTIDHHIPVHHGYPLLPRNAVVLCRSCNSRKNKGGTAAIYSQAQIGELFQTFRVLGSRFLTTGGHSAKTL